MQIMMGNHGGVRHVSAMIHTLWKVFILLFWGGAQGLQAADTAIHIEPVEGRWSQARINAWYDKLPWLVGANYYPASAINQIEMWQASTWDPERIDRELALAASIGMNTMRVFLHDLVWASDEQGLYRRMDIFLNLAAKHGIKPSFVFFDDCHYPRPKLGPQPLPVKGWHNSGWVNSPGRDLANRYAQGKVSRAELAILKGYVQRTMREFANDSRVLYWELYNEPGRGSGENGDMGANAKGKSLIGDKSAKLVQDSWIWAREVNPSQPITSTTLGSVGKKNIAINYVNSDMHSIHSYRNIKSFEKRILTYKKDRRPIIVTEWLARPHNTPKKMLPIMKKHKIGAINWGFVAGKSQTNFNWKSRVDQAGKPLNLNLKRARGETFTLNDSIPEPKVWFHDIFRLDFTPFDPADIVAFKLSTADNVSF